MSVATLTGSYLSFCSALLQKTEITLFVIFALKTSERGGGYRPSPLFPFLSVSLQMMRASSEEEKTLGRILIVPAVHQENRELKSNEEK